jgi:hypothetical protein
MNRDLCKQNSSTTWKDRYKRYEEWPAKKHYFEGIMGWARLHETEVARRTTHDLSVSGPFGEAAVLQSPASTYYMISYRPFEV